MSENDGTEASANLGKKEDEEEKIIILHTPQGYILGIISLWYIMANPWIHGINDKTGVNILCK